MASQIYYKFKSAVSSSTLEFDGPYLYVHELKKKLADKLSLGADVVLVLEDAMNADKVFTDPNVVVPKNSTIIVKRVPIAARERGPPLQHSSQYVGYFEPTTQDFWVYLAFSRHFDIKIYNWLFSFYE